MTYNYYQTEGGEEVWKAIPTDKLDTISNAMFVTILSVETPLADNMEKEELAAIKYKGPLYFDLDDSESPASTAVHTRKLISKLEDLGVLPEMLQIYASGGKGFHITVPEACFLTKPPKSGLTLLPAIFKEMAFQLAVPSLDLRVYTARKGRMFRQKNVLRPNGNYKVQLTMQDLEFLVTEAARNTADAEAHYKVLCSTPSAEMESQTPALAMGLLALFDQCKSKVTKAASSRKKQKKTVLPDTLPSFEAMLRGEGIKSDVGFHQLAMQIAITAHAKGMDKKTLLEAADGLCKSHESDSARYGSESKRRAELDRMWEYTDDNPCYTYNAGAITSLLTHSAPDLRGLEVSDAEVAAGIENPSDGLMVDDPYDHAGVILTERGAFTMTENGPKRILALGFENVTELVSATTNTLSVISADVNMGGRALGRKTMDLDAFNSVTNFNKITMPYGQSFSGSDTQARGMMMRLVEKARKNRNRMYVLGREGLDIVSMPFHEDEEVRRDFLVWSDVKSVTPEPAMIEKDVKMKFVGFPDENGQFRTDLSLAPSLPAWLKEDGNKELLRNVMQNLLHCQKPAHLGKLIGWMVACNYRMLFHKVYTKFPLLHINGSAGQGKCLGVDTPVLMFDGSIKKVQDVVVGDKLLGPDGTVRNVLSLARGQEQLYRVVPVKGDSYVVNESHILSLRKSDKGNLKLAGGRIIKEGSDVVNVDVKTIYDTDDKVAIKLKGWRASALDFPIAEAGLPVDAYWLGAWLGDGNSHDVAIYKPVCNMTRWLETYAESLGMVVKEYTQPGKCSGWAITGTGNRTLNPLREFLKQEMSGGKRIPAAYKTAPIAQRMRLLAGLLDSDGSLASGGYDWISKDQTLAEDFAFLCRSLGLAAYIQPCQKGIKSTGFVGNYWRVRVSGDCERIPCLDKKAPPRRQVKRHLVHGITVEKLEVGDYYGFTLDGDKLFLLGDFTVTHNTEMTLLMSNFHYYKQTPKMLTPTSTLFAVSYAAAGSASIPLILDEFKPGEMRPDVYDRFKLMLRDAYNCRSVERGGGNRESSDYRAVHTTALSAPLCFIAEAAESESALMERVVLLTLTKPPVVQAQEFFHKFSSAMAHKEVLGIVGGYMAAQIVQRYSVEDLKLEFDVVYNEARKELMLQEGEVNTLSNAEFMKKSGAKERTVFNYSVVKFGLIKLRNLITNIYPREFDDIFADMIEHVYSTVEDIQTQTIPEWLKVLNNLADMTKVDSMAQFYLKEGGDYAIIEYNGKTCLELYVRSFYLKYRMYAAAGRNKPLFPSEAAFVHALNNLPSLEASGLSQELDVPGGSHILDLDELRGAGFIAPG